MAPRGKKDGRRPKWTIAGEYLDSCNCDWGCPCQFNAKPTHQSCEGLSVVRVDRGSYGTAALDGLCFAAAYRFPGPIHEGHGTAAFYLDHRGTDEQFDALSQIVTGNAGGGPFVIYSSLVDVVQAPQRARISFVPRGIRSRARVGSWGTLVLEPIRNPVTGRPHLAVIELPEGFEASRMEQASTQRMEVDSGDLAFAYRHTYASYSKVRWSGP